MQYLKALFIVLATVVVGAMFMMLATEHVPVAEKQIAAMSPTAQDKIWRASLVEKAKDPDALCKLSDDLFDAEPRELLMICDEKGMLAYALAKIYPQHFDVFTTYYNEPLFWKVLRTSEHAVPIIAYLIERESTQHTIQNNLGVIVQSIREKRDVPVTFEKITPEQYGLMGIIELSERGHNMMEEFEIVNGEAKRKPFTRALNVIVNVLAGNTKDFERIYVRAERMPTWRDYGKVAIDATIVLGATGIIAKALRPAAAVGKAATAARATSVGAKSLGMMAAVGRSVKLGTVVKVGLVATAVAAVTQPRLMIGVLKSAAQLSGINPYTFMFGFYAFLLLLIPGGPLLLWLVFRIAFGASRLGAKIARRI